MRVACVLGREIVDAAHRIIRPGVTTDEIDRVVHEVTLPLTLAMPTPIPSRAYAYTSRSL